MTNFWYIIRVLPGKERQLAEHFNEQISLGKLNEIIRFICPTENEFITLRKKKVLREKVIYNGYIYFETTNKLSEDELKHISINSNILSMSGSKLPSLMSDSDVRKIMKEDDIIKRAESKLTKYIKGETVIINDGPFKTFEGTVVDFIGDKINLEVKIFGRNTPVTLDITQINKI